jgi:hypothetical protein
MLGLEISLTDDPQLLKGNKHTIAYSKKKSDAGLYFNAHGLLSEDSIEQQEIIGFPFKDTIAFFRTENSAMPFDVFAASFFLISRYEEYLSPVKDKHDRFPAEESVAFKNNFLHQPVIDKWLIELKTVLSLTFTDLKFRENKTEIIPTIDIDQLFFLRHKSFIRILYSFLKSIHSPDELKWKFEILTGKIKDPFDQYERLESLHAEHNLSAVIFFLSGKFNAAIGDINLNAGKRAVRNRIRKISEATDTGIHPSYAASSDFKKIFSEKAKLEAITGRQITKSRHHFLRIQLPETYNALIAAGIEADYTMGYASQPGFRAGTSFPFYFFNLQQNKATELRVIPFCVMDAGLRVYSKLGPEEAFDVIRELFNEVKKVNGKFIPLWHNESLSGNNEWRGWKNIYERMLLLNK